MVEPEGKGASPLWRWLRTAGLGIAIIFLLGVAAGFLAVHLEHGGGFELLPVLFLAAVVLCVAGCGWLIRRELRATASEEPLTRNERLNRNILVACGALGAIMAMVMIFAGGEGLADAGSVFSNRPLPPAVAIMLILVIGVIVPILSVYWHRVIDEQEADAYKTGAVAGFYLYGIGAPVWWLAWRGGLAPAPDGIVIYMATLTVVGAVWIWRKYR